MSAPRFPITYEVELHKVDGEPMELSSGNRPHIVAGPPVEFGGGDAWWSPEHLLVSAAAGCFTATFLSLAQRAELRVGSVRCRADGVLDRVSGGTIGFVSIRLAVVAHVLAGDVARTRAVLEDAKKHCFVANSLRCPVELAAEVEVS
jgi:organic hydroperoxide reductase OsmC/OhrA